MKNDWIHSQRKWRRFEQQSSNKNLESDKTNYEFTGGILPTKLRFSAGNTANTGKQDFEIVSTEITRMHVFTELSCVLKLSRDSRREANKIMSNGQRIRPTSSRSIPYFSMSRMGCPINRCVCVYHLYRCKTS